MRVQPENCQADKTKTDFQNDKIEGWDSKIEGFQGKLSFTSGIQAPEPTGARTGLRTAPAPRKSKNSAPTRTDRQQAVRGSLLHIMPEIKG